MNKNDNLKKNGNIANESFDMLAKIKPMNKKGSVDGSGTIKPQPPKK